METELLEVLIVLCDIIGVSPSIVSFIFRSLDTTEQIARLGVIQCLQLSLYNPSGLTLH